MYIYFRIWYKNPDIYSSKVYDLPLQKKYEYINKNKLTK